jgi:hypothetical protein
MIQSSCDVPPTPEELFALRMKFVSSDYGGECNVVFFSHRQKAEVMIMPLDEVF